MAISTQLSADGQELTIAIQGRFDFGAHQAFRDAYERVDGTPKRYQVDLQGTTYLDSSALGMLLLLRDHAGGEIAEIGGLQAVVEGEAGHDKPADAAPENTSKAAAIIAAAADQARQAPGKPGSRALATPLADAIADAQAEGQELTDDIQTTPARPFDQTQIEGDSEMAAAARAVSCSRT